MWLGQAQTVMRYMNQTSVNPKSVFFPLQPNKAQVKSNIESIIYHRPILYHFTNQIQISVETLYGRLFSSILSQYIWQFNRIIRIQVCNGDRVCFHRCKGTEVQWRDVNSSVKFQSTILWLGDMEDKIGNRSQITKKENPTTEKLCIQVYSGKCC